MRRALLLSLLLLVTAFTGCLSGDEDSQSQNPELQSRAEVSEQAGGIQGVVTDEAVQPIEGVDVTLSDTGRSETTASDGSFAFSNVEPGLYTLALNAPGFIGTEQEASVQQGDVTTVEITLAHRATVEPFSQQFEFKGFLECSVRAAIGLAVCAVPNSVLGGNATNDRFIFFPQIEENPWQIVSEMQWEPNQPLADRMTLIVEPQGLANDDRITFAEEEQASPIIMNTDRATIAEVVRNLTAICEGEMEPDGTTSQDAYCNRDYIENGGDLQLRVFVEGINEVTIPEGVPEVGGATVQTVGLAIQQEYQIIETVFYNTPACEDYSVLEQNTCEQAAQPPDDDPYETSSEGNTSGSGNGTSR